MLAQIGFSEAGNVVRSVIIVVVIAKRAIKLINFVLDADYLLRTTDSLVAVVVRLACEIIISTCLANETIVVAVAAALVRSPLMADWRGG